MAPRKMGVLVIKLVLVEVSCDMREAAACRTLSRLPGRVTRLHSPDVITAVTVHGPVH